MKLVLDDMFDTKLKDYLLRQDGIKEVEEHYEEFLTILNIKYTEETTPEIIMKYIEFCQKNDYSILVEFDKGYEGNFKVLKYTVDDMCCEYCYKGLVMELFNNKMIKAVSSNFDYNKPAFDIEFLIEYDEKYNKKDLVEYIEKKRK